MTRALALLLLCGAAHAGKLDYLEAKNAPRARAADARLRKLVGKPPPPLVSIRNLWTYEVLPIERRRDASVPKETFDRFLRCHWTNEPTDMDPRLQAVLVAAAVRFEADRIEIVSGFRAPKFNLMLRKKGHEVARDSQHTYGHAVDFRVPGVPTRRLLEQVRSMSLGGVGFYPDSAFVHADTGPVRYWAGR
ncbi:MAG TPA: DUF882 domain-containing protein [Haliangiales bacterium]|nr:DUF882 domain-containing protein [Haliangiales bacterium]